MCFFPLCFAFFVQRRRAFPKRALLSLKRSLFFQRNSRKQKKTPTTNPHQTPPQAREITNGVAPEPFRWTAEALLALQEVSGAFFFFPFFFFASLSSSSLCSLFLSCSFFFLSLSLSLNDEKNKRRRRTLSCTCSRTPTCARSTPSA